MSKFDLTFYYCNAISRDPVKITILFPAYYSSPIGGYNVHLKYANLLSGYGHQVSIVFPHYLSGARTWKTGLSTVIWATRLRLKSSAVSLDLSRFTDQGALHTGPAQCRTTESRCVNCNCMTDYRDRSGCHARLRTQVLHRL